MRRRVRRKKGKKDKKDKKERVKSNFFFVLATYLIVDVLTICYYFLSTAICGHSTMEFTPM